MKKERILTFVIGVLAGAILATAGFLIYNSIVAGSSQATGEMGQPPEMPGGSGGTPPEMPNGEQPPEKPSGNNSPESSTNSGQQS